MPCTITGVTPISSSGTLSSIEITGTAAAFATLDVMIICGLVSSVESTTADGAGNWSVTFTSTIPSSCACDGLMEIQVTVSDGSTCPMNLRLDCREEAECPTLTYTSIAIGSCSGGLTPFTLIVNANSADTYSAYITDSSGVVFDSYTGTGSYDLTLSTSYGAETQTWSVIVTSPAGCPGWTFGPMSFSDCPDCPDWTFEVDETECDESGNREVTLTVNLDSADTYSAELRDSAGTVLDSLTGVTGAQTMSYVATYAGGTSHSVTVAITDPACGEVTQTFDVSSCGCPDIDFSYDIGDCDTDGNRPVSVEAELTSSATYSAELRFSDGSVLDSLTSVSGTNTLSASDSYAAGTTVTFTVVITSPSDCGESEHEVDIPSCDCPVISEPQIEAGECDSSGDRSVTVTAEVSSTETYTVELRDSGGTTLDTASGPGTTTLSHTGTYAGGTSETFTVAVTDPPGCDSRSLTVDFDECEDGNGGNGNEGCACSILRVLAAILVAIGIVVLMVAACTNVVYLYYVGAALIVVGIILLVIYALLCPDKACDWFLLFSGQVLFGVGVALLCLANCCTIPFALGGLVAAGAGFAMLLAWKKGCDKNWCDLAWEVLYMLSVIVLPVIGWINVVPALSACVNNIVVAGFGTAAAALVAYVSSCTRS